MAEIDLVSSHTPWAPLPHMVDWNKVGDGSIFDSHAGAGPATGRRVARPRSGAGRYGRSVQYSLNTLISFVQTYHDKNLVLVVLGDHQPARSSPAPSASHDVPITIIAHDPAVMKRISGWGWQDGLRPGCQLAGLADGRIPGPLPHGVRSASTIRAALDIEPQRRG